MERTSRQQLQLVAAGGFAGAAAKTSVAPLERIRLLSQTGSASGSALNTFRKILSSEGVRGLWRGNLLNCYRVVPSRGVLFSTNDFYKNILAKAAFDTSATVVGNTIRVENRFNGIPLENKASVIKPVPFWLSFLSGSCAGMTASVLTYPLDVARTRVSGVFGLQYNTSSGPMMLYLMLRNEGILSWYRGISPTLLGAVPYEGIKFMTFDIYGSALENWFDITGAKGRVIAGAFAGATAGLALYPNDTIRRLLQLNTKQYKSVWHCWTSTYSQYGITRFYKGIFPYLIRMVPNSAIQFGVYGYLKALINEQ